MSKTLPALLAAICLCLCAAPLSAAAGRAAIPASLASLHRTAILPVVSGLGKAADRTDGEPFATLRKALGSPYGLEWAEAYLDPDKKKALVCLHNDLLSGILPAARFFLGEPVIQNGVCAIAVLLPDAGLRLDLLLGVKTRKILYINPREVDL